MEERQVNSEQKYRQSLRDILLEVASEFIEANKELILAQAEARYLAQKEKKNDEPQLS